jgi:hypothetical protein
MTIRSVDIYTHRVMTTGTRHGESRGRTPSGLLDGVPEHRHETVALVAGVGGVATARWRERDGICARGLPYRLADGG